MPSAKPALPSFLAIAGVSALFAAPMFVPAAHAASLNLNLPSCSTVSLTDLGGGNYRVDCGGTTTPPPAGAPTGCVITQSTSPSPLTSSGGAVTLAATCAGTTANTTWSWTKNSAGFGGASSVINDNVPANGGAAAASYAYAVNACNGSACATTSSIVSVPGVTAPPTTGPIACAGFNRTIVIDVPWQTTSSSTRILTNRNGGFGSRDALVLRITVPAGANSYSPGSLTMAEWGGGPLQRFATLSQTPCDFNKGTWFTDAWTGPTISLGIQVGGGKPAYTAWVAPGQVYYLNVRNTDRYGNFTCEGVCDMFVDFSKPYGT